MYFHGNDFVLICSCKVLSYLPSYPCKGIFLSIVQTYWTAFYSYRIYIKLNIGTQL